MDLDKVDVEALRRLWKSQLTPVSGVQALPPAKQERARKVNARFGQRVRRARGRG